MLTTADLVQVLRLCTWDRTLVHFSISLPEVVLVASVHPIIQGVRLDRSENYCLLHLKYENYGLFNPTGGSPDVVHLIK